MVVALILVLVAVGSVLFHLLSPWWWTPIASNWGYIDNTIIITFWITGVVFAAVVLFMAYCVFRFRHREGRRAALRAGEQEARMVAHRRHRGRRRGHAGAGPVRLEPVRHRSGRRDRGRGRGPAMAMELPPARQGRPARHVRHPQRQRRQSAGPEPRRSERPGRCRRRGDDLHLPVGKPVKVLLRSIDVLHDFYVPEFRAKMDMIPGMVTYFWFTPTRTGTFEVLCAELCGSGTPSCAARSSSTEERLSGLAGEAADIRGAVGADAPS